MKPRRRTTALTVPLVLSLVAVTHGCGASRKPDAGVRQVGTIFSFLVELVANSENEEYPEGQKHAAVVLIPASNLGEAEQGLATAAGDGGWKVVNVLQVAEGYPEVVETETPELAAAVEAARQGNNVVVVFSDPIPASPRR